MLGTDDAVENLASTTPPAASFDIASATGGITQFLIKEESATSSVQYCCDDRLPQPHSREHPMSAIPIEVESIDGDGTEDVGLSSSKVGDLKKKKNEDGGESGPEKSYLDMEQSVAIFNDTVLRQFIDNFLLEWNSNTVLSRHPAISEHVILSYFRIISQASTPKFETTDKDQAASVLKAKDDNGISPINANASGVVLTKFSMYLPAGNTLNFLSGYIISKSYSAVLNRVHPDSCSQVAALQCESNYVNQYVQLFTIFMGLLQMPLLSGMFDGLGSQIVNRWQLYSAPMSKLRMLMISFGPFNFFCKCHENSLPTKDRGAGGSYKGKLCGAEANVLRPQGPRGTIARLGGLPLGGIDRQGMGGSRGVYLLVNNVPAAPGEHDDALLRAANIGAAAGSGQRWWKKL
ncbi:hypothetical protein GIB67_020783, partial [Kingdonia uniflora]